MNTNLKTNLNELVKLSQIKLNNDQNLDWQNMLMLEEIVSKLSVDIDFMNLVEIVNDNLFIENKKDVISRSQYHVYFKIMDDLLDILYKRIETYDNISNSKSNKKDLSLKPHLDLITVEIKNFENSVVLIKFFRNLTRHLELTSNKTKPNVVYQEMENLNKSKTEEIFSFLDLNNSQMDFTEINFINNIKLAKGSQGLAKYSLRYNPSKTDDLENLTIGFKIGNLTLKVNMVLFIGWMLKDVLFCFADNENLLNVLTVFN